MDRLTALIAIAHLRLRLDRLARRPDLLEDTKMTPKLQGLAHAMGRLKHDIEAQADVLTARIEAAGNRGSAAFAKAHQTIADAESGIGDIESFIDSLEGANGGPSLAGSAEPSAQPERLSRNGVAQD